MNANAREIAQRVKDGSFNKHGGFEIEYAESIISEALAEKDKEIARMREAVQFSKETLVEVIEHFDLTKTPATGELVRRALTATITALLPAAEKEES